MIQRQRRAVQAFPVRLEALDVDVLAIFQLKLHEMDVHRMRVLGEVLEIPRLGRADPRRSVIGEWKFWPSISTSSGSSMSLSCSFSVNSFGLPMPSVSTSVGMSISVAGSLGGATDGVSCTSNRITWPVVSGSTGSPSGNGWLAVF